MKRKLLVGDSGGTGTDWCLVDENGRREYFSGDSYHPSRFSEAFFESMRAFWESKQLDPETEIHFYGAGCSVKHNQDAIRKHFNELGFTRVFADSDLLGTCRGLLGDAPGLAAILGTGSVLAAYDGKQVTKIHGGFGYLIGDEGSGYAFGRKLIHAYLNGDLSPGFTAELFPVLGDRSAVLKSVYGPDGKQWIGRLSLVCGANAETERMHRENISEFVGLYLDKSVSRSESICLSGSYAFHNLKILSSVLQEKGLQIQKCVAKPIETITDYAMKATL